MRMQNRRATIRTLETLGQRFEQAAEHERQRLEPFDGPFEIQRLFEMLPRYLGL